MAYMYGAIIQFLFLCWKSLWHNSILRAYQHGDGVRTETDETMMGWKWGEKVVHVQLSIVLLTNLLNCRFCSLSHKCVIEIAFVVMLWQRWGVSQFKPILRLRTDKFASNTVCVSRISLGNCRVSYSGCMQIGFRAKLPILMAIIITVISAMST